MQRCLHRYQSRGSDETGEAQGGDSDP